MVLTFGQRGEIGIDKDVRKNKLCTANIDLII